MSGFQAVRKKQRVTGLKERWWMGTSERKVLKMMNTRQPTPELLKTCMGWSGQGPMSGWRRRKGFPLLFLEDCGCITIEEAYAI